MLHKNMSHSTTAVAALVAAGTTERPAGAAPFDQVLIATGAAALLSAGLGVLVLGHRTGRIGWPAAIADRLERHRWWSGTAGWAILPLVLASASLVTALLGMYWDIALHVGVGRDEGPLANPAHYPIMFGLFGISAAGVLACALPRDDEAGPAAVRLSRDWRAPVGGLLLTGAGTYALLGFPLDDVWHRLFGQDVTLWGPTHLMLIGGAGLSLVAMTVLVEEGRTGRPVEALSRTHRYLQRGFLMGGMLIGLSVFQAEFDFGVPQYRLVLQPFLVATAAALVLVAARLWAGPGGALVAAGFYLLVRGGVSVVVGPWVLGELWSSVPLYVGEAVCVELLAVLLARRPLAFGAVSGVLVGTVGFAAEYTWSQLVFRLPWTPDVVGEGMTMAVVGGVAGGLVGAMLALGLDRRLPGRRTTALLFTGSLLAVAGCAANGLVETTPSGLGGRLAVDDVSGTDGDRVARVTLTFDRPPVDGSAAWLTMTGWQGGAGSTDPGLYVEPMQRVGAATYVARDVPVSGTWKTMVRLHDGRALAALPVYLPEDTAIDEPELPATDGATRLMGDEELVLQRELEDDVPGWLWLVAGLAVLACSVVLAAALGWGVGRFARAVPPSRQRRQPVREPAAVRA